MKLTDVKLLPLLLSDRFIIYLNERYETTPRVPRLKLYYTHARCHAKAYLKAEMKALNASAVDSVCDKMDDFDAFISNELEILKLTILTSLRDNAINEDTDKLLILSDYAVLSVLSQLISLCYRNIFKHRHKKLEWLKKYTDDVFVCYYKHICVNAKSIQLHEQPEVMSHVLKLANTITDFGFEGEL